MAREVRSAPCVGSALVFSHPIMKGSALHDDGPFMMSGGIAALKDVTQRFDQAAVRTVEAASGLSDPSQASSDLPSAIVDLAVSEKVVKATIAAVKASSDMDSAVLDIVA